MMMVFGIENGCIESVATKRKIQIENWVEIFSAESGMNVYCR